MKQSVSFIWRFLSKKPVESSTSTFWNWNTMLSERKLNIIPVLAELALAAKYRAKYYINNWVYTTNHKRIAVNYFWFVIFSGICGMILATIIRLEMAYPGVGVLAGDSLQYLSIVTAHAVVMVFFMIMPLLFGAFGNFLLPTQLGVHDVAFPRLNSAAFWFLPAGLLMLVQLVCLDRRYQRMNCYNIREIQTLLKSKYTPNSTDNLDVRFSLDDTSLGLRYFLNGIEFIDPSIFLFYRNAITNHPRYQAFYSFMTKPIVEFELTKQLMSKTSFLYSALVAATSGEEIFTASNSYTVNGWSVETFITDLVRPVVHPSALALRFGFEAVVEYFLGSVRYIFSLVMNPLNALRELHYLVGSTVSANAFVSLTDFSTLFVETFKSYYQNIQLSDSTSLPTTTNTAKVEYSTASIEKNSVNLQSSYSFQENTESYRYLRLQKPVFQYNFKVGNYFPDSFRKMNLHLFTTINDVTTGIRKAPWFLSPTFTQAFNMDFSWYLMHFSTNGLNNPLLSANADKVVLVDKTMSPNLHISSNAGFTNAFYNFFLVMNSSPQLANTRAVSINALEQKFYKMFATSSMQQRIYANWRQLKFTREAWRCKLLAARHQNTLYKRYLNEDSVVWAVERNAKDVLPGWAMITPFSARTRYTAIGKVDLGLMGVFLVLNSSIVSSANFLVTYRYLSTLNNRKMRDARSFFTEGVMVASWMMIAANPMLAIGILMLLSDRHWQTSFFDYSGGGDTVLFQHMFWFFGHPEVYVIMIPAFGFNNTILSFYLRKRVSARASLLYSMYTIAFLGFFVWGHHMYMVGLAHTTRMLFSTLTVMISVPAATKLMHWSVTIVNSSFVVELPFIFQLLFIFFFVSGGISGMAVAHTGMDILFHDSFYVVGHFHVMLAGSAMFASFGAFYFYFPAIFGVRFSRIYGYLHCIYYLIGQLMTVVPMFWLGYAAMPRRVLDYPSTMGGWHSIVSAGHMLSVAGMAAFFIMIFDSLRQSRAVTRNWFGVARFNTRINFYIYEGARTWYLQRRGWHISRMNVHDSVQKNELNYSNYEFLETTLYSYVVVKDDK